MAVLLNIYYLRNTADPDKRAPWETLLSGSSVFPNVFIRGPLG